MWKQKTFKIRVRFSGLCFTTFIVLDFIASLNSAELLVESLMSTKSHKEPTKADLNGIKRRVVRFFNQNDMKQDIPKINESRYDRDESKGREHTWLVQHGTNIFMTEEDIASVLCILLETFLFLFLLVSNILALLGLIRKEAYLMVPWLCVYLLGICR